MSKPVNTDDRPAAPLNRDIEFFLTTSTNLEMDFGFGLSELNRYLQDISMLQAGVKFKDLGISERKNSCLPKLIIPNESTYQLVDRWDIQSLNDTPFGSIALLNLRGVMRSESGLSSPGVDRLAQDLRNAYNNPNVKGVVLETLSGGGESMAGNILKSALQERNKPVVGFVHLGASAAYRALTGTDEIIASSAQAEFGSIGTMITLDKKTLEEYRERFVDIYGTDVPNKNGDLRAAIEGDFSKLQTRIDSLTKEFHKEIMNDRPLRGDQSFVKETLSGAVFNATESKRRGLVDAIGNLQFAIRRVNALKSKY